MRLPGFLRRFFGMPPVAGPGSASVRTPDGARGSRSAIDADGPGVFLPMPVVRPPNPALDVFVDSIRQLPLFSGTAMQLMRSVGQDDTQVGDLVRLIATDPGLVAQLLRVVNSPYYGLPSQVATVGDAVAVLGFDQIRRLVSAAVLKRPLMSYLHDTEVVRRFWRHELICAALARHLAFRSGGDGEMAYMAGLMHEIGRLAMMIEHPRTIDPSLQVEDGHGSLAIDLEVAYFGFDHAAVGGALLSRWGLPDAIVQATYDHGRALPPSHPVSAAVWQANLLAHRLVDEIVESDEEPPWMTEIGLTAEGRRRMLAELAMVEADQR